MNKWGLEKSQKPNKGVRINKAVEDDQKCNRGGVLTIILKVKSQNEAILVNATFAISLIFLMRVYFCIPKYLDILNWVGAYLKINRQWGWNENIQGGEFLKD